jgi:IS5 family transposase
MRKAMDRQQRIGCSPVLEVELNFNCRDEIVPILAALQHLYAQPKLRDGILSSVAADVNRGSSRRRGRAGMDYWPILVLGAVRLGCNLNYDKLQDLSEQHHALRQIMGISDWDEVGFDWRRIRDNLTLIRPATLERINRLIVGEGHRLVPGAVKSTRADSFVVGTNVHYPTESSLIRDGLRKVIECAVFLAGLLGVAGWRQHVHLYRKVKRLVRETDRIAARKGAGYQERIKSQYVDLLALAQTVLTRADELLKQQACRGGVNLEALAAAAELKTFLQRTRQVCGTATRRVINGETVPNGEKLFSIFETHTQLYKRGKAAEPIQFGRLVMVYEDGAGFITHSHLPPRDVVDRDFVVEQTRKLQERLGGRIERASFDRGFHSPENQTELAKIITCPCLPKPGATQAAEQEKHASVHFRQARQSHPGVESAINALQCGNGLLRCRDRTESGFERYLQTGRPGPQPSCPGQNFAVSGKCRL